MPTHMVGACDVPRDGHLSVPFPIDFTWIVPDDGFEAIKAGARQEPVLGCFQVVRLSRLSCCCGGWGEKSGGIERPVASSAVVEGT